MSELPAWVRWLLVGRFLSALGSMAWVFVPLYLVSDRHLSEGSPRVMWAGGALVGGTAAVALAFTGSEALNPQPRRRRR